MFLNVFRTFLLYLENPERSIWGSITLEEEEGIKYAVEQASKYDGPIIEIGALFGHTTNLIVSEKKTDVPMIAIDNLGWNPFYLPKETHRVILTRTIRYALEHCSTQFYEGDLAVFYDENHDLKPSMVFIDALHDYESVKKDINWAVSNQCAIISGHDYSSDCPGVMKAVDESFDEVRFFGTVWVAVNKILLK